jgi:hypothetical protein
MSDTRWFEIDSAVAAAAKHFAGAVLIYQKVPAAQAPEDRYLVEMAFMHAMQAGHTSLENALLRILELCSEDPPTGGTWHADLIRRAANPVGGRPVVLHDDAARAADVTRRFRSVAVHAYDDFDHAQAAKAVASAAMLINLLPAEIGRFRQTMDA